jgi:hypothetical protein
VPKPNGNHVPVLRPGSTGCCTADQAEGTSSTGRAGLRRITPNSSPCDRADSDEDPTSTSLREMTMRNGDRVVQMIPAAGYYTAYQDGDEIAGRGVDRRRGSTGPATRGRRRSEWRQLGRITVQLREELRGVRIPGRAGTPPVTPDGALRAGHKRIQPVMPYFRALAGGPGSPRRNTVIRSFSAAALRDFLIRRFSLMDRPGFLVMGCRGDLLDMTPLERAPFPHRSPRRSSANAA